jgi:hypothetical protein
MTTSATIDEATIKDVFDDIDDFIVKMFPLEYEKLIKERKTPTEEFLENIDKDFANKLSEIINPPDNVKSGHGGRQRSIIGSLARKIRNIRKILRN